MRWIQTEDAVPNENRGLPNVLFITKRSNETKVGFYNPASKEFVEHYPTIEGRFRYYWFEVVCWAYPPKYSKEDS